MKAEISGQFNLAGEVYTFKFDIDTQNKEDMKKYNAWLEMLKTFRS